MPFIVPSHELLGFYQRSTSDWFEKISSVSDQIVTLTNLRDTLLPKLLSGQLRIPDAEKLVADAV
jgi:type I restriction enzyme S subunit